jgi:hypothetical protein
VSLEMLEMLKKDGAPGDWRRQAPSRQAAA